MEDSKRRLALLAIGLLLVTVPLYAPLLHLTGTEYEYRNVKITVENNELRVIDDARLSDGFEGIDYFREILSSRPCVYEARALNGTVAADHPNVRWSSGSTHINNGEQYVSFGGDNRVFRRTADWRNGSYVLGLERLSAREALDDVAQRREHTPEPMVTAVEEGSVTTHEEELSDENQIVKTSDGYFVVYQSDLSAKPGTERLMEWTAVLFGANLLRRL